MRENSRQNKRVIASLIAALIIVGMAFAAAACQRQIPPINTVAPTGTAAEPTDTPVPGETSADDSASTTAPEGTTAPEVSSDSDVTTAPEATTTKPEETTEKPEETTAKPEETTKKPEETTAKPEETTAPGPEPLDFGSWNLTLVNPWNTVPAGYADKITLKTLNGTYQLDMRAYDDYCRMISDCRAAGNDPAICAAFRSAETQTALFLEKKNDYVTKGYSEEQAYVLAAREVGMPGTSEHQLGLAVDLVSYSNWNLDSTQANTATQKWLAAHSWEYGFIQRYPSGKTNVTGMDAAPWHYRYVGVEAAKQIHDSGMTFEEFLEANGVHCHSGEWTVGKLPTCSEDGYMTSTCPGCKKTAKVTLPATGEHKSVTDAAVAATCTAAGKTEGSHCSVCGKVLVKQQTVAAIGHVPTEIPAVKPTCTESGLSAGSRCAVCGTVITAQKTVPAAGHTFVDGKCTVCHIAQENPTTSAPDTEPVEPPVETYDFTQWNLVAVNPWNPLPDYYEIPTSFRGINGYLVDNRIYPDYLEMIKACQAAGNDPKLTSAFRDNLTQIKLYYNKVNNLYKTGKYTLEGAYMEAARHVTIPGTSEHQLGLALDLVSYSNQRLDESQESTATQQWFMKHSWEYGFILRYPNDKSAVTGIIYEPWHYRYVGREMAKIIHESGLCYEEFLEAHGVHLHQGEWKLGALPTCTTDGYFYCICRGCGEELRATLPSGDSIREMLKGVTDATVIKNLTEVADRFHVKISDPAVAATCTTPGHTAGTHCSDCGAILTGSTVIPATGHTLTGVPAVPPTCTEPGMSASSVCAVCGKVISVAEVIPATGHSAIPAPDVAPTCTAQGATGGTVCEHCGIPMSPSAPVPALGHTIVDDPVVDATCTAAGHSAGSHCKTCGETIITPVIFPATGHDFVGGVCTKCGAGENDPVVTEPETAVPTDTEPVPTDTAAPEETSVPAPVYDPEDWKMDYVNGWNPLPDDFVGPSALHNINGNAALPIDERVYPDYLTMIKAMQADGLRPSFYAGYVSRAKQLAAYYERVDALIADGMAEADAYLAAAAYVELPGTSEHETGLGIDLVTKYNSALDASQEGLAERKWLLEHAWEYGFVPRYPTDKSALTGVAYNVWHYRYVGAELAAYLHETGMCFEEYLISNGVHLHHGAWEVGKLPTATEDGWLTMTCITCGTEIRISLPARR